jgi:syntaxin 16
VQRALAAKLQDLSASFRKKQRVYLESESLSSCKGHTILLSIDQSFHLISPVRTELQGHAIKNQDLLIAAGTVSLKGSEGLSAVDEDVEAAVSAVILPLKPPLLPHSHDDPRAPPLRALRPNTI